MKNIVWYNLCSRASERTLKRNELKCTRCGGALRSIKVKRPIPIYFCKK